MRLHELTKELGADGKKLLELAKELGLGVKSHSSNVQSGAEGILRAAWAEEVAEMEAAAAKKAAPAEAPAPKASGDGTIAVTIQGRTIEPEVEADEPDPVAEVVEPAAPQDEPPAAEPVADAEPAAEPAPSEAAAEVVDAPAVDPAPEAADDAPAEEAPAAPEAATETPAEADTTERPMVVTFGGQPAGGTDEEPEPEDAAPLDAAASRDTGADDDADDEVKLKGRVNVPTSRERKGAKILGRIDLKPADTERTRRASQPAFDPLDPTRAMPSRDRAGTSAGPGAARGRDTGDTTRKPGRPGKGGQGDFVFDPEDNTSLSAIRLGHFNNRRRPSVRRPPMRRGRGGPRKARKPLVRPTHAVTIRPPIGVRDLSEELGIKTREILMHFTDQFDPRDKNAVLEAEHLLELAVILDRDITVLDPDSAESRMLEAEDARAQEMGKGEEPRPPVVAVMGHVDHGKTTLLDYLRKSRVAAKEAGGITQVTSAYSVETKSGARVTFLDTPGHKAFTEMRARGASVTDVALLVVAADDGVMEQTQEAIDHARAAGVPIVVAINKIDKGNADPMKVRQQLASAEILVEDYGGDVGVIECSATTGQGIDELLERLALETEILELTADPHIPARGVVIDSRKDSKLGVVVTAVIQEGTLRPKDSVLAGTSLGRVRWLLDDRGGRATEAGPSMPVQIVGFDEPPAAGADLICVADINVARDVVAERKNVHAEDNKLTPVVDAVTLDNLFDAIEAEKVIEVNVLLKAGNMASLDVLRSSVEDVSHPEVRFKVIRAGVGGVTEDDVLLASASGAFIIGFGVVPDTRARSAISQSGVDVKYYDVIYEMTEDLEQALEGQLGFEQHEEVTGHANIRAIFKVSRLGNIAGCYVTDGIIRRDSHVRLVRDGTVVHTGRLETLRRFKDDVKEVRENYECGMNIAGYNDIREGDVIEAYTVTEVKRTLESTSPAAGE